jgi:NADH dehydrogenase FAD-containing subunit
MKDSQDPDFGATGQFELSGVYHSDRKLDAAFASTLGLDQIKSLVLLGAGPVHVQVLHELARQRRADLDVTLVTPNLQQVPAALLPGVVAGLHNARDCHTDLTPLLQSAGVRWMAAQAAGLDAGTSSVLLDHVPQPTEPAAQGVTPPALARPSLIGYHLLSVDANPLDGCADPAQQLKGAAQHGLCTSATALFLQRWPLAAERLCRLATQRQGAPLRLVVVGQGGHAFELACALHQWAWSQRLRAELALVTHGADVVSGQTPSVRRRALGVLKRLGIAVVPARAMQVLPQGVALATGHPPLTSDLTLVALESAPPVWLAASGLRLDTSGHMATNDRWQSVSHPQVLATPCGHRGGTSSGAAACEAAEQSGAALALNLRALASEQPLATPPQGHRPLGFVDCGYGQAIAHWGPWSAEGRWAWRWKHKAATTYLSRQRPHALP